MSKKNNQSKEKVDTTETQTEDASESKNETTEVKSENAEESEESSETTEDEPTKEDSELERLKEENKQIHDKYLRLHSEFDNFRRRTAKENLQLIETANSSLILKLLEVSDNFDRAFSEEHKADSLEKFEEGIQIIHKQLQKILAGEGLSAIDPTGEEFDPTDQEAMVQQPSDEVPENHVLMTFQKGYKLKEKILRPAKVIVSSGPAS